MATVQNSCPYRITRKVAPIVMPLTEERFDFQFAEDGKVERVSLGVFDLDKEVESHKNEAGLINALLLAQARGLPDDIYAKKEGTTIFDPLNVETYDDLLKAKADADARLSKIAESYGLTLDQLLEIAKSGKYDQLKKPEEPGDPGDGGQE